VAQRSGMVTVTDIVAGPSPVELRRTLDRLFRRGSHPSALFCMHSEHTLTTYMHLLQMGRSVPQQVSLISRDSRALLDASLPELSRYSTPTRTVAVRAARLVEQLLASPRTALKPHLVIPRFLAGRTICPPPADPRRTG
jgi:DNA-binding LacI/PurR family transcriptional regulator